MQKEKSNRPVPIKINFNDPGVPENARTLHPLVWQDQNSYCVLLGPDPEAGIFACGETIGSALRQWDTQLKSVLATKKTNTELRQYIKDALNASYHFN